MASERFVLCRRDLDPIGDSRKFCAKPITKKNPANWCAGCLVELPIWPQPEVVA